MSHWCDFCQVEHSSASCYHPGRVLLQNYSHKLQEMEYSRNAWKDAAEIAEAEVRRILDSLQDPMQVHANMLKGTIATISWRQHCHLTGEVFNGEEAQLAEIVKLREQCARLTAALIEEATQKDYMESKLENVEALSRKWREQANELTNTVISSIRRKQCAKELDSALADNVARGKQ